MSRVDKDFKDRVLKLVAQIPKGRLMTYGQIAALCGHPDAAWEVGQIAHFAPCANLPACERSSQPADLPPDRTDFASADSLRRRSSTPRSAAQQESSRSGDRMARNRICPFHDIPWQRVVNKQGGLARGYTTGGYEAHKRDLEAEGVAVDQDFRVDIDNLIWYPDEK